MKLFEKSSSAAQYACAIATSGLLIELSAFTWVRTRDPALPLHSAEVTVRSIIDEGMNNRKASPHCNYSRCTLAAEKKTIGSQNLKRQCNKQMCSVQKGGESL